MLEKNPQTLAEAKRATRDIESEDKGCERLWKKGDKSIPNFIPIHMGAQEGTSGSLMAQPSQPLVESALDL